MMPQVQGPLFAPLPNERLVTVVKNGKYFGLMVWEYPNGDILMKNGTGTWRIPKGAWETHSNFYVGAMS